MRKEPFYRMPIYFLTISLLLMTGGFSKVTEATGQGIPIGEMMSRGEVRFEARENQWRSVESSYFPVFQGIKIKTDKGAAVIALGSDTQIDLAENSLVFIEQNNRFNLSQGRVDFRFSPSSETSIRVRSLWVTSPRSLHASKGPAGVPGNRQEAIGSIMIHPNGAVTVKSHQGTVSVIGQDRSVLTTLSSKDMVTIPSAVSSGSQKLAQAGDPPKEDNEEKKEGGGTSEFAKGAAAGAAAGGVLAGTEVLLLGLGTAAGAGGGIGLAASGGGNNERLPGCGCVCLAGARNGVYPCP
jgi:hypothetical protein